MTGGWRTWGDKGCYEETARLIDQYLTLHFSELVVWQRGVLAWHAGQMYAFGDDYGLARVRFLASLNPNEPPDTPILWNDYVYATVAFLDKNIPELRRRRDKIANGPDLNGAKANLNIVDSFLKCPDEPY